MIVYTPFGERSRKGRREPVRKVKRRPIEPGQITRRNMTAEQLAAANLYKALAANNKIPSTDVRRNLTREMENLEGFRYLNMQTLAAALTFLYNLGNRELNPVNPEDFTDDRLLPLIQELLPEKEKHMSPEERGILILKQKATLLRYIRAIEFYRQDQRQLLQNIRETAPMERYEQREGIVY